MPTTTTMTVVSSNDDVLALIALLFLFNILSATIALFLHFRLVHMVKRLKRATIHTMQVLQELETSCDNWVNQTKKLKTMLKLKHHLLEIDVHGIVPKINDTIKSELSHQTQVLNKQVLNKSNSSSTDPPTSSYDTSEWDHDYESNDYESIEGRLGNLDNKVDEPAIERRDGEIEMTGIIPAKHFSFDEKECFCEDGSISL